VIERDWISDNIIIKQHRSLGLSAFFRRNKAPPIDTTSFITTPIHTATLAFQHIIDRSLLIAEQRTFRRNQILLL
jgi:hypothetical protein